MDAYSLSMEDYETLMELSKFQGRPSPSEGILPAVKAALTKAYKEGSSSGVIRTADLITLPGIKKPPKRIAAILEPVDELKEENGDAVESVGENLEDAEELGINGTEHLCCTETANSFRFSSPECLHQIHLQISGNGSFPNSFLSPFERHW